MHKILTQAQQLLIEKISHPNGNLSREQATVSIYLYFNRLAKPANELKSIIATVDPTLLDDSKVGECLDWMKHKRLVRERTDDRVNMRYIEITAEFESTLEQLSGVSELANELRLKYNAQSEDDKVYVKPKGNVGAVPENYTEMLCHIQSADSQVNYAVLATDPYPDTVSALKKAADQGAKVQILVANEEIAQAYKGKSSVESQWRDAFKNTSNVSIRVFEDKAVLDLCSSVQIDSILRFDIYDPNRTRSLDGYLLELRNKSGESINLIRWYTEKFEKAWSAAYSTSQNRWFKKILTPFRMSVIALIVCAFLYFERRNHNSAVLQTFVDEILLAVIVSAGTYIVQTFWRHRLNICSKFAAAAKAFKGKQ